MTYPFPSTLIDHINESLQDGNQAVLHQDAIRFLIAKSDNKVTKLLEYMDLIEELTGHSANQYHFDIAYKGE